jgi:proteasome lid subunit RPN8/RPN11
VIPLVLSQQLRRQIENEGARAFPSECCGIMVGRDVERHRLIERLMAGQNVFEPDERYHRFSIDPRLQLQAEREAENEGKMVVGFYHSHPNHPARPSEYDRAHGWPFYSYVIVSIMDGKPAAMTSWVLNDQTEQFEEQGIVCGQ